MTIKLVTKKSKTPCINFKKNNDTDQAVLIQPIKMKKIKSNSPEMVHELVINDNGNVKTNHVLTNDKPKKSLVINNGYKEYTHDPFPHNVTVKNSRPGNHPANFKFNILMGSNF